MTIEVNTLYHLSVTISLLLGVLLLYSWRFGRTGPAIGYWGAGMFLVGVGFGLLGARGAVHHALSIAIANAVMLIAVALFWTGARVFDGRRPHIAGLVAGAVIWLVACMVPAFYASINARTMLVSALLGGYTLAAAYELWRGQDMPLPTRWPAIVLMGFHGLLFFARVALVATAPLDEGLPGASSAWYVVLHYEVILYEIALAFSFLAMAKERPARVIAAA